MPARKIASLRDYAGNELTLTATSVPGCYLRTWATPERINGVGLNEAHLLRIVNVEGTRVVMAGPYPRLTADADEAIALMRQIVDSVTFTPQVAGSTRRPVVGGELKIRSAPGAHTV